MKAVRLAAVGLGLLLSGCQLLGPDYQLPKDAAMQRPDLQGQLAGEGANVVSAPVPDDWWKLYQDPKLNELVRQALAERARAVGAHQTGAARRKPLGKSAWARLQAAYEPHRCAEGLPASYDTFWLIAEKRP